MTIFIRTIFVLRNPLRWYIIFYQIFMVIYKSFISSSFSEKSSNCNKSWSDIIKYSKVEVLELKSPTRAICFVFFETNIISSSNSLKASSEEYVDCFGGIYTHPINKLSSLTRDNSYMIYIIRNPILWLDISAYGGGVFVSLFFERRCSSDYFFRNVNKMAAWIPDITLPFRER